jgi:hypothetical protein
MAKRQKESKTCCMRATLPSEARSQQQVAELHTIRHTYRKPEQMQVRTASHSSGPANKAMFAAVERQSTHARMTLTLMVCRRDTSKHRDARLLPTTYQTRVRHGGHPRQVVLLSDKAHASSSAAARAPQPAGSITAASTQAAFHPGCAPAL